MDRNDCRKEIERRIKYPIFCAQFDREEQDEGGIPKDFSMQIVSDDKLGKITKMSTDLIDDFEGHPFPVRDD